MTHRKSTISESIPIPFAQQDTAQWIWSSEGCSRRRSDGSPSDYEVRLFRGIINLPTALPHALLHISADSRYVLYVDGCRLGRGPAHGDIRHCFYDTYRLEGMSAGKHVIAVEVLDYSKVQCDPPRIGAPCGIMTRTGGLLCELYDPSGILLLKSDRSWKVQIERTRHFQPGKLDWYGGFIGHFEEFLPGGRDTQQWKMGDFDDRNWESALEMYPAQHYDQIGDHASPYGMMERMIPHMQISGGARIVHCFQPGGKIAPDQVKDFALEGIPLEIEAGKKVRFILELDKAWTGYPSLEFRGGRESLLTVSYAEALRLPFSIEDAVIFGRGSDVSDVSINFADARTGWTYDNRGELEGFEDRIHPDGGSHCWEPHHWRTAKFLQMEIQTKDEPLVLERFDFTRSGYPLKGEKGFRCSDPSLQSINDTSFHTLRLCLQETFIDCPYYEQLQYAGDSPLSSLAAMLCGGAYPATRQFIYHMYWSIVPEGWTQSRYPARDEGIIPSQSLDWVTSVRDYTLHSGDLETARSVWHGINTVLDAYARTCGEKGVPEKIPYWNWIDWTPGWKRGIPPGCATGPALSHAAKYGMALRHASDIAGWLQLEDQVRIFEKRRLNLRKAARRLFWNGGFFSENLIDREYGSRIGNALAVLAGFHGSDEAVVLAENLTGNRLANASFFGLYFVRQALWELKSCDYRTELEPWYQMQAMGLTTWAEDTVFWRSLCHGWSANPLIDLRTRILGVQPVAPGFEKCRVAPRVDLLEQASGEIFTPKGLLRVHWERKERSFGIEVPQGVLVTLKLPDQEPVGLKDGSHRFTLTEKMIAKELVPVDGGSS